MTIKREVVKRQMGIDFGLKRIGLAWSDPLNILACSLSKLLAESTMIKTVEKLLAYTSQIEKEFNSQVDHFIVGLPLLLNGQKGFLADEVLHFVEILKTKSSVPVIMWDERLTSVQAERALKEKLLSRKKRSTIVDSESARIILQSWLDCRSSRSP